jgi:hypothetical protein
MCCLLSEFYPCCELRSGRPTRTTRSSPGGLERYVSWCMYFLAMLLTRALSESGSMHRTAPRLRHWFPVVPVIAGILAMLPAILPLESPSAVRSVQSATPVASPFAGRPAAAARGWAPPPPRCRMRNR